MSAYRYFTKHKSSFILNCAGLSVGLACSILIYLWVMDERSVDKFHPDNDRIYQVMEHQAYSEQVFTTASTPGLLSDALKQEFPEFEYAFTYTWNTNNLFTHNENASKSQGIYASPDISKILHFDVLEGDPNTWLDDINTVIFSEEAARKYFGNEKALDQLITLNNKESLRVTGVYKDIPENASLRPEFIMPFEKFRIENEWVNEWGNNGPRTIAKLRAGSNPELINEKIQHFIKEKNSGSLIDLFIYPYADLYLYGRFENRKVAGGRIEYVRMFSVIAIFILLIACINFMNLSTARASNRSKEVGIRKTVGANRASLINQFMGESILISFISLLVALVLVWLVLPVFNDITDKNISIDFTRYSMWLTLAGIALITGFIAGSYPALYLSAFDTVTTLKGTPKSSMAEAIARNGLVVFQFVLSITLIVSTILVYQQIQFLQTKNLGYEKENLIYFPLEGDQQKWWEAFREEALKIPEVANLSRSSSRFLGRQSNTYGVTWAGKNPDSSPLFEQVMIDYELVETLGIELVEGRTFSREFGADSTRVMINQTAADIMGMEDAVGQFIQFWGNQDREIIGVMKDFHFQNLRFENAPLFMFILPQYSFFGFIRIQSSNLLETIAKIESLYSKHNPAFPLDYSFMDEKYEAMYRSELRISALSKYFSIIAIFISCLGLFGLSAFTAEQRKKEVGIRKVLGATEWHLVTLLSGKFTKLVLIAIIIAVPLSWWLMEKWLNEFAFRIQPGYLPFTLGAVFAICIAWITVGWNLSRAASRNPVLVLRSE